MRRGTVATCTSSVPCQKLRHAPVEAECDDADMPADEAVLAFVADEAVSAADEALFVADEALLAIQD